MIDYTAISARAVEILGSIDPAQPTQYEVAYNVMVQEEEVVTVTEQVLIGLPEILSGLGLSAGTAFIDKLEVALHSSVITVLKSRGINVTDPETKGAIEALFTSGAITQAERDWVASHYTTTKKVWPGLRPGHVQNALEITLNGGL